MNAPKVFISYSHDTTAHEERLLELADKLNQTGIDCTIDQYYPAPSSGWPLWMEKQIIAADYVLLICTETYYKLVYKEGGPGKGLGVCWEANLIYNLLYKEKLENNKFIPIVFDQQDQQYIPLPLQGYTSYHVATEKGFEDLYCRLTNQQSVTKPDLGPIQKFPPRQRHTNPEPKKVSSNCIHNLPLFNQTHHFGREEFLTQLHDIFSSDNTATSTQTITGLGGVGKTQIALVYAYTYKENYRYIWWVRAENPTTCDLDYQEFARRMDLCGPEADRQEILTKVRYWQEQNKDWLFIYDNAMEHKALEDYLPRFPKGHLLITTRNHHFAIGNPLPVDVLTPEIIGEFLRFRTGWDEPGFGTGV